MELTYWLVRSSSMRGGDVLKGRRGYRYFRPLRVSIYKKLRKSGVR